MNNRLCLFASRAARRPPTSAPSKRRLYTDSIYPYPFKYINEEVYPTLHCYRETWQPTDWMIKIDRKGIWGMRFFWTYWFWSFFHDPQALYGHHSLPDPSKWTDEELGIPPLEAGSYVEWAERKIQSSD